MSFFPGISREPRTLRSHVTRALPPGHNFLELFYLVIIEFSFEDSFWAKTGESGWMKANMAAASYHPRILSPNYGKIGNVKPLTANRSLSFAVK